MSTEQTASNLRADSTPAFTSADFLALYPQFSGEIIPAAVLDMYLEQGLRCIQQSRWHSMWKSGLSLYIAHHLTMWLLGNAPEGSNAKQVATAGLSHGAVASKSVDGVSVSYAQSSAQSDLTGWGSYKGTIFGEQFATMARIVGKGGMYVI